MVRFPAFDKMRGREFARIHRHLLGSGLAGLLLATPLLAQVITVDTRSGTVTSGPAAQSAPVDRRYRQVEPTHVPLTQSELDAKTRLELIRLLDSEQGFAMRPLPRGHRGLLLIANGKLSPAGEPYLAMVTREGLAAKPGDRVVLTDIKMEHGKIVFEINGGPDVKHRLMRHIQVGVGGAGATNPVVQDDGKEATGARLTLDFGQHLPELTGSEVKALLAPLITFDVKTPVQAFTDTLPDKLKDAILDHRVLVGMNIDMLLFAKGQPESKMHEMDGQMPFDEWIYGHPPQEVQFIRINGNRVIRVEIAQVGEKPVIFTKDEVDGLLRTDGTPLSSATGEQARVSKMGDVEKDPDTQAPAAPPSLRQPGEKLPSDDKDGEMKPVRFPQPKPAPQPGSNPDEEPAQSQ